MNLYLVRLGFLREAEAAYHTCLACFEEPRGLQVMMVNNSLSDYL